MRDAGFLPRTALSRVVIVVLTTVTTVAVLSGCSQTPPRANNTSAPPSRSTEIRLDQVDPCAVLDATTRTELLIDKSPAPGFNPSLRAPACGYPSSKSAGHGYSVSVVTSAGARTWFTEPDTTAVETEVAGFPAVTFYFGHPMGSFGCQLAVETHKGQHVIIGADVPVTAVGPRPTMESLCRDARHAAELAVGSLTRAINATPGPSATTGPVRTS